MSDFEPNEPYKKSTSEEKLEILDAMWNAATGRTASGRGQRAFIAGRMLEVTIGMPNHPEWFKHGCMCDECSSID